MVPRRRPGYAWLRAWPLLLAAVVTFVAGTRLLIDDNARQLAAAALLVIGAVCVGAWIALLSAHDYPGREIPELEPPGADLASAGRLDHHTDLPTDADSAHPHGLPPGPGPSRPPT